MRVRSFNVRSVERRRRLRFVRYPTLVDRKFIRLPDDERAFDHVLQFADVAGP